MSNIMSIYYYYIDTTYYFYYTYNMLKKRKKGIVTIAFDDAYLATYKNAVRHLTKLKLGSTIAVAADLIGKTCEKRPVMSKINLKAAMHAGHEIASHGLAHVNLRKLAAKNKNASLMEISGSKKKLARIIGSPVTSFVFPYIEKNRTRVLRLEAKKCYKYIRITSKKPYFESADFMDPRELIGFAVRKRHSVKFLNRLVDYAAKEGFWIIEVFHLVGKRNTLSAHRKKSYRFFMHIKDFKKHLAHIRSKNIRVLTMRAAVKKLKI